MFLQPTEMMANNAVEEPCAATTPDIAAAAAAAAAADYWAAQCRSLPESTSCVASSAVVLRKLASVLATPANELHVVTDFDMTMTQYWVDGQRGTTSHGVVERYSKFPAHARLEIAALLARYYPMEIDATMAPEVKRRHMIDWWRAAHDVTAATRFTRRDVAAMVAETPFVYRRGALELLSTLVARNIQTSVFSAGVQNVIHESLATHKLVVRCRERKTGTESSPIRVFGNVMRFEKPSDINSEKNNDDDDDDDAVITGFEEPLIHLMNKSELGRSLILAQREARGASAVAIHPQSTPETPSVERATPRAIILLGDSLQDAHMADGFDEANGTTTVLRVGLVNHHEDVWMPRFRAAFDILLVGDVSLHPVIDLLKIHERLQSQFESATQRKP